MNNLLEEKSKRLEKLCRGIKESKIMVGVSLLTFCGLMAYISEDIFKIDLLLGMFVYASGQIMLSSILSLIILKNEYIEERYAIEKNINDNGNNERTLVKAIKFTGTHDNIELIMDATDNVIENIRPDPDPDFKGNYYYMIDGEEYYLGIGEYIIVYSNGHVDSEPGDFFSKWSVNEPCCV